MKAAITSPAAGTQLTQRGIDVTGSASDIPPDRYLWLVLRADQVASRRVVYESELISVTGVS